MSAKQKLERLAAAGASLSLMFAAGNPATAETSNSREQWPTIVMISQGKDYIEMEKDNNSGYTHDVMVCDKEADGNAVYAYYEFDDGAERAKYDPNGSKAGCGHEDDVSTRYMVRIWVCEERSWRPDACEYEDSGL